MFLHDLFTAAFYTINELNEWANMPQTTLSISFTAALFGLLIYFTIASKIVNFRFELVEM